MKNQGHLDELSLLCIVFYKKADMKTVLIGGGTGLVGQLLSIMLRDKGYRVWHLSRRANPNAEFPAFAWDLKAQTIDEKAWQESDIIINLAGAGIADRLWTKKRKEVIVSSRTQSNNLIEKYILKYDKKPESYIAASAVGFYGDRGTEWLSEEASPGSDGFLEECCVKWENAIGKVQATGIRTAVLRVGIVFSTRGGALQKMLLPFAARVGNYFGNGKQYYPWIHIEDLCRMIIFSIENKIEGTYNAVAPEPETLKVITQAIAKAKNISALILPAPAFALKMAMGEMSTMLLNSTRASAQKILGAGFQFKHSNLVEAIRDVLVRKL